MNRRTSSIKLTSRRSSHPTVARTFGFEESFERRWECSRQLRELQLTYTTLRYKKSPIFTRKHRASTSLDETDASVVEVPPEVIEGQKRAEQKIHLLKELPWNKKTVVSDDDGDDGDDVVPDVIISDGGKKKKNAKLKRNVTMPTKRKMSWVNSKQQQPHMRSLEDISFPPPPSPHSLRKYMNNK